MIYVFLYSKNYKISSLKISFENKYYDYKPDHTNIHDNGNDSISSLEEEELYYNVTSG